MSTHGRNDSHSRPALSPDEETHAIDFHQQNILKTNVSTPNKTNSTRDDDDSIHSTQVSQSSLIKSLP